MDEGYQKLLIALEKNELYDYLTAKKNYRIYNANEKNFSINNDYMEVSKALNKYGNENPEFSKILNDEMNIILDKNIIGEIYSVCQLIRIQLIKNSLNNIKFDYIDEKLLYNLKTKILANKKEFEKLKVYEAELKERGMMQVFENWDYEINSLSGKHIL